MTRRRRINPPWIPGFWPLLTFSLLVLSVGGYFYLISANTIFERRSQLAPASPPSAK